MKKLLISLLLLPFVSFSQGVKIIKGNPLPPAYLYRIKDQYGSYQNEIFHSSIPSNEPVILLKYEETGDFIKTGWYTALYKDSIGYLRYGAVMVDSNDQKFLRTTDTSYINHVVKLSTAVGEYNKLTDSIRVLKNKLEAAKFRNKVLSQKIVITRLEENGAYYAGLGITIFNADIKKTIKYLWVKVVPYNPVNDVVAGAKEVQCVGPIAPMDFGEYSFSVLYASKIVSKYKLISVRIQYMDGSLYSVTDPQKIKTILVTDPDDYNKLFSPSN
ncbi:hypothetical protein QEG73_21950 [Chitinophagaceae bacterium 26-R-25]|nr:hypothetical protein [Chitinophagaceae bacterium 26-R-25]